MPRSFKKNVQATHEALATGFLQDKRSFISQPKIIKGECEEARPHLLLAGVDKAPVRAEIFRRNREKNGGVNRCVKCNILLLEHSPVIDRYGLGEWHHIRKKPGQRCDCPENGEVVCGGRSGCHRKLHPQVQFGTVKKLQENA